MITQIYLPKPKCKASYLLHPSIETAIPVLIYVDRSQHEQSQLRQSMLQYNSWPGRVELAEALSRL